MPVKKKTTKKKTGSKKEKKKTVSKKKSSAKKKKIGKKEKKKNTKIASKTKKTDKKAIKRAVKEIPELIRKEMSYENDVSRSIEHPVIIQDTPTPLHRPKPAQHMPLPESINFGGKKQIWMWLGVSAFTILIFGIWFLNLTASFSNFSWTTNTERQILEQTKQDLKDIFATLNETDVINEEDEDVKDIEDAKSDKTPEKDTLKKKTDKQYLEEIKLIVKDTILPLLSPTSTNTTTVDTINNTNSILDE